MAEDSFRTTRRSSVRCGSRRGRDRGTELVQRALLIGMALLALPLAVAIYGITMFDSPPFALERLDKLSPGMNKAEVEEILGGPGETYGQREWVYSRPYSWPIVKVYFDDEGRFVRSEYDR